MLDGECPAPNPSDPPSRAGFPRYFRLLAESAGVGRPHAHQAVNAYSADAAASLDTTASSSQNRTTVRMAVS